MDPTNKTLLIILAGLIPTVLGIVAARKKGATPHLMWFGIIFFPIGAWITYLLIQFRLKDKSFVDKLKNDKDIARLIKAHNYTGNSTVRIEAGKALAELKADEAVDELAITWISDIRELVFKRDLPQLKVDLEALAAIGSDTAIQKLIEMLSSKSADVASQAADALKKCDPDKLQKDQQEIIEHVKQQRKIVAALKDDASKAMPTSVTIPMSIKLSKGGAFVAGKVISGLLTAGLGAAGGTNINLSSGVNLPENCLLCGQLKGVKEKEAFFNFKLASGVTRIVGVNPDAVASLKYKVCGLCSQELEQLTPLKLASLNQIEGDEWHLGLEVLNADVAQQIQKLNSK